MERKRNLSNKMKYIIQREQILIEEVEREFVHIALMDNDKVCNGVVMVGIEDWQSFKEAVNKFEIKN